MLPVLVMSALSAALHAAFFVARRVAPDAPTAETLGLLALIRLHLARAGTRFTARHDLVLLREQDRAGWDQALIADALILLDRAAALRHPGPYQLQAAIVACHTEARTFDYEPFKFGGCGFIGDLYNWRRPYRGRVRSCLLYTF